MPGSSSSSGSFIPTQKKVKAKRTTATRRVYLFSLFSYISLFAVLVSIGGLFLYKIYLQKERTESINALNTEIKIFKRDDMLEVQSFESRLKQAKYVLDNSVSYGSIFRALEGATTKPVQITNMSMVRMEGAGYDFSLNVLTDSFDATIFQRDVMIDNPIISEMIVEDFQAGSAADKSARENIVRDRAGRVISTDVSTSGGDDVESGEVNMVDFTIKFSIPISEISYVGTDVLPSLVPETETASPDLFEFRSLTEQESLESNLNEEAI